MVHYSFFYHKLFIFFQFFTNLCVQLKVTIVHYNCFRNPSYYFVIAKFQIVCIYFRIIFNIYSFGFGKGGFVFIYFCHFKTVIRSFTQYVFQSVTQCFLNILCEMRPFTQFILFFCNHMHLSTQCVSYCKSCVFVYF